MATLQIRGPHGSRQAILRIVRFGDGFFFAIEGSDVTYRPENFFFHATGGLGKPRENCRLDIEAIIAGVVEGRYATASYNCGAFIARELILGEDFGAMFL